MKQQRNAYAFSDSLEQERDEARKQRDELLAERENMRLQRSRCLEALLTVERWLPKNPLRADEERICRIVRDTIKTRRGGGCQ